jgi:hypothetical protein
MGVGRIKQAHVRYKVILVGHRWCILGTSPFPNLTLFGKSSAFLYIISPLNRASYISVPLNYNGGPSWMHFFALAPMPLTSHHAFIKLP